jgi:hypothetical protein
MKRSTWIRWAAWLAAGATVLQVSACTEQALVAGSAASVVTAGGVIYIVTRILTE